MSKLPFPPSPLPSVVAIYGPTACGKTALSLQIAEKYNGECINVDSRQVYRGMSIGTGKILPEEMRTIPHHLLDFKNPDESISVGEFVRHARAIIADVTQRGKLPILVGWTGLYLDAVLRGFEIPSGPPDWDFRKNLEQQEQEQGPGTLWNLLYTKDPISAQALAPGNLRYIIRALEVLEKTGVTKSAASCTQESPYNVILVTPYEDTSAARAILYANIDTRTAQMFSSGLLEETQAIVNQYGSALSSLNAIGYQEALAVLRQEIPLPDAIALAQKRARNYAKRQMTWFRRYPRMYGEDRCKNRADLDF